MELSLAPLQGMTIACCRNAFAGAFGGMDAYYAPFIGTSGTWKLKPALFKDILPEHQAPGVRVIPQLLGNSGPDFLHYAQTIAGMGYREINWNIGCPYPMVTHKKKGSGLLPYPDMIRDFLEVVCAQNLFTLTVKMRLGFDDPEEGFRVMEVLNRYPLGEVIIHARTGVQMYAGHTRPEDFAALSALCVHPVTYNGDIFSPEDFHAHMARFPGTTRLMLGRGALADPFLPAAIRGTPVPEDRKISLLEAYHRAVFEHFCAVLSGDTHVLDKMKEFWSYLGPGLDPDALWLRKLKKCRTVSEYRLITGNIFAASCWRSQSSQALRLRFS